MIDTANQLEQPCERTAKEVFCSPLQHHPIYGVDHYRIVRKSESSSSAHDPHDVIIQLVLSPYARPGFDLHVTESLTMYLIASYGNMLSPENADLSEVEQIQLLRKVVQGLKENALKKSNMWPQGLHGDIYGPHEPPSTTWPLDYVPDQIVDSIVDAAADHARFHDHTHHKMCGCKPAKVWSLDRPVYSWTPYTPRVKYLA